MENRRVVLPLTEAEWQALCANARTEDRTPNLQAKRILKSALGLVQKEPGEAVTVERSSNTRQIQPAAA